MGLDEFYPLPQEDQRWTLLARPVGEVILHERIAADAEQFNYGVLALDAISNGARNSVDVAGRIGYPPGEVTSAISCVANAYGARTIPQTVDALFQDRLLHISKPSIHKKRMPWRGWQLIALAAEGRTDQEIKEVFSAATPDYNIAQLWRDAYTALDIPPELANKSVAVRRAYELGKRTVPPESPVIVFSVPHKIRIKLTPREKEALNDYREGITRSATAVVTSTSVDQINRRRRNIENLLQAMSMNEALAKTILLNTDRVRPIRNVALDIDITINDTKLLAGLALGYSLHETAQHLKLSYVTAKDYLRKRIFLQLDAHTQGETIFQAFQSGLFVVGNHPIDN
jgi:DNA-binding NarL/FixJ family response regulator